MRKLQKYLTWALKVLPWIVAVPIMLFVVLCFMLYMPPVQRWAVDKASEWAEAQTGYQVRIEQVRLKFPLDLVLGGMEAIDAEGDTLLRCKSLCVEVPVRPLLQSRVDVGGLQLRSAFVNTKDLVSDTHVEGRVGRADVQAHGYNWEENTLMNIKAEVADADIYVCLTDTAPPDTTPSTPIIVELEAARIANSRVVVVLPGDTTSVDVGIKSAKADKGHFDTGKNEYLLQSLDFSASHVRYANINVPAVNLLLDEFGFADNRVKAVASLATERSMVQAGVTMPLAAFDKGSNASIEATLKGSVHPLDMMHVARPFLPKDGLSIPKDRCVVLDLAAAGNMDKVAIERCNINLPSMADLKASGEVRSPLNDYPVGDIKLQFAAGPQINSLLHTFIGEAIKVPADTKVGGKLAFVGFSKYDADLRLTAAGGAATMKGNVDLKAEAYKLAANTQQLPIKAFVADIDASPITAQLQAEGHGFDPTDLRAYTNLKARISDFSFADYTLENTRLEALIKNGQADLGFDMRNRMLEGGGRIQADMHNGYTATVEACVDAFHPYEAKLLGDTVTIGANFIATACLSHDFSTVESRGYIDQIAFITPDSLVRARDLDYDLLMQTDSIYAKVASGDLQLAFNSSASIDRIVQDAGLFADELLNEVRARNMNQARLSRLLPMARLTLDAGSGNPVAALLSAYGYSLSSLHLDLDAAPERGLSGTLAMGRFGIGELKLDTIYAGLMQDSTGLKVLAHVDNYKKDNRNRFRATLDAYALASGVGADIVFKDEQGRTGIDLGVLANLEEEGLRVSMYPHKPILAYRTFTLNDDNFIYLGNDNTLRANVDLLADDGTGLKLYGAPTMQGDNDLSLSINRLNLGELSDVLMFLPRMGGYLSGDVHLSDGEQRSAMASLQIKNFAYEGIAIGNVGSEITYLPKDDNEHYAEATLELDGAEIIEAKGSYFDRGEGSFVGDVAMTELPLRIVDAFLSDLDFGMTGNANANFHAEGPLSEPVFNGSMIFEKARLYSRTYGVDFTLDPRPVEIHDSKLHFEEYALRTTGASTFTIDGDVDASKLSKIEINLALNASDFELINTKREKESMVFGKVITDFKGKVTGDISALTIRGDLEVNNLTDATLVLRDSPVSVGDEFEGLVTFMDFQDSTYVESEAEAPMNIDARINMKISDGAKFRCFLSENGRSYVSIVGGGDFRFRYDQNDGLRLTGRYTIENGQMKYELPIIPLKTFTIARGSYVDFTGDIGNPLLSIKATEIMKSNVSTGGVQTPVNFEVGVEISQQLSNMGMAFLIDAPEDANLHNELMAMTQDQRNKTAVAMMATGMYVTDEVTPTQGLSGSNALNMFLAGSISSIAGTARNTVDIDFDINDRINENGVGTTDYNFAFSKRFWGDRINVVIGGKVSAGAEAINTAESIIDNISVEYRLDRGSTRYIRAFYNRSSHDVLDGTLMKTGVGMVLRRKTNRLGELFIFKK